MQTVYDLLRRIVDDHHWRNESDRVQAHGVINAADPSYVPPAPTAGPQLTNEQLYIRQLEAQLAAARGQSTMPSNAAEQLLAAQGYSPQPTSMATAQPQNMQQYAYPVPQTNGPVPQQPVQQQVPTLGPTQMRQYGYPLPNQQPVQVTPFQ